MKNIFQFKKCVLLLTLVGCSILSYAQAPATDLTIHEPTAAPPAGATFEWREGELSSSPLVSDPTAVAPGLYYGFYNFGDGCFSQGTPISVITNTCPTTTGDLSTAVDPAPAGVSLSYHVSLPVSAANEISGTAITEAPEGTYYVAYKSPDGCYSNANPIVMREAFCGPCDPVAQTTAEGATLGSSGINGICIGCSVTGESNLVDTDLSNSASINIAIGVAGSGFVEVDLNEVYPSGTRAGFIADVNGGVAGLFNGVTLTTYLNGVEQENASGGSLVNIFGLGGGQNIAAVFCEPFDKIRITAGSLAGVFANYQIFNAFVEEGCEYDTVCDGPCDVVEQTTDVGASLEDSGITGFCLLCSISGEDNVVDTDLSNFASINIAVGVFSSGYIDINLNEEFPSGTRAGFVADVNGGIAGLFNGVTLSTYLNGSFQESISGGSLINILGIGGNQNIAGVFCEPFDRIRITAGSLAGVLANYRIYNAFVVEDCLYPVECGNPSGPEICDDGIDNDGDGSVDETEDCIDYDCDSGLTSAEICAICNTTDGTDQSSPLCFLDCDNDGAINRFECDNSLDPLDPDTDGDGNPDGQDPNPTVPTVADDSNTGTPDVAGTTDILSNDDFLPNNDPTNLGTTSITDTGNGTADGTIVFDPEDGTLDYTPTTAEAGMDVTVVYEVCNDESGTLVCEEATVTITVSDLDCNAGLTATEICDICNTTDGTDQGNSLCALDCDSDGATNGAECDNGTDPTDPDTDGDGNPDGTDPNPTVPTAADDTASGTPDEVGTTDILSNDDFLPNNDPNNLGTTSITDTGNGTADGTIVFDPEDGTLDYTPTTAEAGMDVTVVYEVCNDESGSLVCEEATVTITVADLDCNSGLTASEICELCNTTDGTNQGSAICALDCDSDGSITSDECDNGTDPTDPDTDGDGNPDGTDPNPTVPTAADDTASGTPDEVSTTDILSNDDFLPNNDPNNLGTTSITDTGDGTAEGTIVLDPADGTLDYTPTVEEAGMDVTVVYEVCNDESGSLVCEEATVTITVADLDCNSGLTASEICELCNTTDGTNQGSAICALDCDSDGSITSDECDNGTDPTDPDTDGDGNPDGTDPNPTVPTAADDTASGTPDEVSTTDILSNDDFLPNNDPNNLGTTSITDTGDGTAEGTIVLDPADGTLDYTPTAAEAGMDVTVVYEVCNDESGLLVCEEATVTITVADLDCNSGLTASEICELCNTTDGTNQGSAICALDCDSDGSITSDECDNGTDPTDPDTDGDGNPDGTDPNPTVPTAADDTASGTPDVVSTTDILSNDDFLPNNDPNNLGTTSITDTGDGTAEGTIVLDPEDGTLDYTPTVEEAGMDVTVVYEVCNDESGSLVCEEATVTITVADLDCNSGLTASEICELCNTTDGTNQGSAICALDCDSDGSITSEECDNGTDPTDPDTDGDGNPDGTDPNPTVPTAADDTASATPDVVSTTDILSNDDFLPNNDPNNLGTTSITDTGDGTAEGTIVLDPEDGTLDYTPTVEEAGMDVTVVYEVCNDESGSQVCEEATVTITVADLDCNSGLTASEICELCNTTDGTNQGSAICALDCDSDGSITSDECDNGTDPTDPDTDGDGNPDGTDPNPTVPTAADDTASGTPDVVSTTDILSNDDFLPNNDPTNLGTTSITDTGDGTAEGTIVLDPADGTLDYTPTVEEAGMDVTVVYEVCNDESGTQVCEEATVTITVADLDCNSGLTASEICELCNTTDGTNQGSAICALDCDSDGSITSEECDNGTDPTDPDTDGDGNPDGTDPNPTVPTAADDTASATPDVVSTTDILSNDDFLPNNDPNNLGTTSITDTGDGTAEGTIVLDPEDGTLDYTPTVEEAGMDVTVVYEVCNDESGTLVCEEATVTITVLDLECNSGLTASEICELCNTTNGTNQGSAICSLDCDSDGITASDECDNGTDPTDPDTDGDGNPDGTDPNPTVPTAADDSNDGTPEVMVTTDILSNDDFLPNNDPTNLGTTSITDTGNGTAEGTIVFDPEDGTLDYTPTVEEGGMDVTIVYEVCNDESGSLVCEEATVTITVEDNTDTDGDGEPDITDIDDDNDGIPDVVEAATAPANGDTDGDGIPDTLDLDSDNDGIADIVEAGGTDANNDGLVDDPTDSDNDGLADVADVNPAVEDEPTTLAEGLAVTELPVPDTDGDGQPDFQDLDSDNDGINDIEEAGIADVDNNGIVDDVNPDGTLTNDPDGDGWAGSLDPTTGGTPVVPVDTDGDETPDYLDLDSDNDGINDVIEGGNGLFDTDNDGVIEGPDLDNDGILDVVDQTPLDFGDGDATNPNEAPTDTDGDMVPDYQDLDSDNDSINDTEEAGLPDPNGDGLVDDPLTDTDGDGIPDSVDGEPGVFGDEPGNADNPTDTNGDGTPDFQEVDSDNDGTPDIEEAGDPTLDPNGDGVVDDTTDPDGDGIVGGADLAPNDFGDALDTDGDGTPDSIDIDDDNDGIPDVVEAATAPANGDTDGDGIPDTLDLDSDNDGIADIVEAGGTDTDNDGLVDDPTDADDDGLADVADVNPGVADDPTTLAEGLAVTELPVPDTDGDGQPDFQDLDSDNDGINDIEEAGIADVDNNGIVDDVNPDGTLTDDPDGDGWAGSLDPTTGGTPVVPVDTDGDETPDYLDLDSDNDGINDVIEGGNGLFDTDNDGVIEGPDLDNDGILDVVDQTPLDFGDGDATNPNEAPTDTDGDMIPDYQDLDSDNDSINDTEEAGLPDPNGDGQVDDPLTDTDGDGIPDSVDGVPGAFGDEPGNADNPTDTNGEGTPDFQEVDSDNDGTPDIEEAGDPTLDPNGDGVVDDTTDPDGDGIVGGADLAPNDFGDALDTDGDGTPDSIDIDDDNDGIPDVVEAATAPANGDTDGDGIPDTLDLDSDNDGIADIVEAGGTDTDNDGLVDDPTDADDDGLADVADVNPGVADDPTTLAEGLAVTELPVPDTDGDGQPDFQDLDSDNDGINDIEEAGIADVDNNGIVDDVNPDGTLTDDPDGDGWAGSLDPTTGGTPVVPVDTDGDETPDYLDLDSDNDGVNDVIEGGNGLFDTDNDGVIEGPDLDDDGILDVVDQTPLDFGDGDATNPNEAPTDTDGDMVPDYQDLDSDNDSINDTEEAGLPDPNGDGLVDDPLTDTDGDGIPDSVDGEPGIFGDEPGVLDNPTDTDGDGTPDFQEVDSDDDGTPDIVEGGEDQTLDGDGDGVVDDTTDPDGDGIVGDADLDPNNFGDAPDPDTDGDGNPDSTDPNPTVPTVADDSNTGTPDVLVTTDILSNDDYLPNNDPTNLGTTTITNTGDGTAVGTVALDPQDGTLDYTPTASEAGKAVTVVYEVCNDESGTLVCAEATVTITVEDFDCDSGLTSTEICELCNTTDGTNQGSAICDLDCDTDGLTAAEECDGGTDPNDPDTDGDGNPDGQDPNPTVPTAADDIASGTVGEVTTEDILSNDDYLPNNDPTNLGTTSITDTGDGTAEGTIVLDPQDGTLDYTPTAAEAGMDVTVVYEVCNDETGELVCEEATVTITVADEDCNTDLSSEEICELCNTTDGTNQGSAICDLDCDNDGLTAAEECDGGTDPNDPDTDGDGNPDGQDPNPLVPTTADDTDLGVVGDVTTTDILANDDFLANNDPTNLGTTTITDTGDGTAVGEIDFDPFDGTLDYTPVASEAGKVVTVVYEVCNDETGALVCEEATVTYTVADLDCDSGLTAEEICELCNTTDGTNQGSALCDLDCDSDGTTNSDECNNGTSPLDACDPAGSAVDVDCDGDGLTNNEELTGVDDLSTTPNPNGEITNPALIDTDGDGVNDGDEAIDGTNPNDACSFLEGSITEEVTADPDCSVPNAVDDNELVTAGETIIVDVLDNDTFGEDGLASITVIEDPLFGSVVINDGGTPLDPTDDTVEYTPNTGYTGSDSFGYQICDADGDCDEATAILEIVNGCTVINTGVFLEGPFIPSTGLMTTTLNDLGYLPGQEPSTFFGIETPAGQPYNIAPWSYDGTEGDAFDYNVTGTSDAGYPSNVTDWVLVSLRSGTSRETTLCTKAALLLNDGTVQFIEDFDCCDLVNGASYYLVIEHRNHLIVMSHEKIQVVDNEITYDFRIQESFSGLFGFDQKLINGSYVMYGGNGEQIESSSSDTDINVKDKDFWLNRNGDNSSYYLEDLDLNGDVNVQDKNLWSENNGKFTDVPRS